MLYANKLCSREAGSVYSSYTKVSKVPEVGLTWGERDCNRADGDDEFESYKIARTKVAILSRELEGKRRITYCVLTTVCKNTQFTNSIIRITSLPANSGAQTRMG